MYRVYCDDVLIHDGSSPDKRVHLISPVLKLSDSASGTFTATIPVTNIGYDICERMTSTIYVYRFNKLIWSGRIIQESKDFKKNRKITCEGALSYLIDTVQEPVRYSGYDVKKYVIALLNKHNAKKPANRQILPGTIRVADINDGHIYQTNYKKTLEELNEHCVDRLGGHMVIRYRQSDKMAILDYVANYPSIAEQEINFGYNLLDFTSSWDVTDLTTVLIPRGARLDIEDRNQSNNATSTIQVVSTAPSTSVSDANQNSNYVGYTTTANNEQTIVSGSDTGIVLGQTSSNVNNEQTEYLTIESVNGGSIYLVNQTALAIYGRFEQVIDFGEVTDPNVLKALATNYMNSQQFDTMQITMTALDMHVLNPNIDSFELLDMVHCVSVPHGMNKYFPVLEINIPLDAPQNVKYTLGLKESDKKLTTAMVTNNIDMSKQIQSLPSPTEISDTVLNKVDNILIDYAHISDGLIDNARIDHAKVNDLQANYAHISDGVIDNAKISYADVDDLEAHYAHIENGVIDNANINDANVNNLRANYAHLTNGVIDNADIGHANVQGLNANYAHITDGEIDNAKINQADVNGLRANYAHIADGVIDNAKIDQADVNNLSTNYARIVNGIITNATIDQADVNNLAANYARIIDGEISNATIDYANVNDLDVHYALVDMSNTSNAWIDQGTIRNGAISSAMIANLSANKITSGTLDASNITVINLNANSITTGYLNGARIADGSLSLAQLTEDIYTEQEVDELLNNFKKSIDGTIELYTGDAVPTLNNMPAADWINEGLEGEYLHDSDMNFVIDHLDDKILTVKLMEELDRHVGDIYYVVNPSLPEDQYAYRFVKIGNTYSWERISDSDVAEALNRIATAEGKITTIEQFDNDISTWKTATDSTISSIQSQYSSLVGTVNKTIIETYPVWISRATTAKPAKPTAHVTNTDTTGNKWSLNIPAYGDIYPYYFYCYEHKFVDGTYGWTDVVYDQTMTEVQQTEDHGLQSIKQLWTTRGTTSLPTKPSGTVTADNKYVEWLIDNSSLEITDSNGNRYITDKPWTVAVTPYNEVYRYYFYCWESVDVNGIYSWSDPVYDSITTNLQNQVDLINIEAEERVAVENSTWNKLQQDIDGNSAEITTLKTITETTRVRGVEYIAGTQSGATANWTGSSTDLELYLGKKIAYKLPYASSSNVTLALTLGDGSTTEAIPVYINGTRVTNQFEVGSVIDLTYDGNYWRATGYWTEDTFNRTQYDSNIKAAAAITAGRIICGTISGYKNIVSGVAFDLSYPLLYARNAIASGASGSNNDIMASNINYGSNATVQNGGLSKVVYLNGTVSGGTFTISSSNWLTCTVPTSIDNLFYIPLGVMSSSTNGSFSSSNTLWRYFDGKFQPTTDSIVTTSNTVNTVNQKADSNSAKITNLTTRLGTNADGTGKTNDIVHKVSEVSQTLDTFQTTVSSTYATKEQLDDYTIGGRNLLRLTQDFIGIGLIDHQGQFIFDSSGGIYSSAEIDRYLVFGNSYISSTAYNEFAVRYLSTTSSTSVFARYKNVFTPVPGMKMILSMYVRGTGSVVVTIPELNTQETITTVNSQGSTSTGANVGSSTITLASGWSRVWIRWEFAKTNTAVNIARQLVITSSKNTNAYICGLKLEESTKPTAWTPAPEDTNELVNNTNTVIEALIDRVEQSESSITQTSNSILSRVNEVSSSLVSRMDGLYEQEVNDRSSSIEQLSESITAEVSETYATKSALYNGLESESSERNSQIRLMSDNILSSVNNTYVTKTSLNNTILEEVSNRNAAIQTAVDGITLNVANTYSTKQEVNNMVIGDRNYLKNTKAFKGFAIHDHLGNEYLDNNNQFIMDKDHSNGEMDIAQSVMTSVGYEDLTVRHYDARSLASGSYIEFVRFSDVVIPVYQKSYILSFNAYGSGSIRCYFYPSRSNETVHTKTSQNVENNNSDGNVQITLTGSWKRYWVMWTFGGTQSNKARHVLLRLFGGNQAYVCGIKLEEGTKNTAWSPALEDAETKIDREINSVTKTMSELKLKDDSFSVEISKKTDNNHIIASINLSPEQATISAEKVNIKGSAEFQSLNQNTIRDVDYIYYAATTSYTPNLPTNFVNDVTGSINRWTKVRPAYNKSYPITWVATQHIMADGRYIADDLRRDNTTTVIDGASIITGSVNADKLAANSIEIGKLTSSLASTINSVNTKVSTQAYEDDMRLIREDIDEAAKTASNYLSYDARTGELTLGANSETSQIVNVLTNTKQAYRTNSGDIAWFGLNSNTNIWEMFIDTATVVNRLQFNSFSWIARSNGNMTLKWTGV